MADRLCSCIIFMLPFFSEICNCILLALCSGIHVWCGGFSPAKRSVTGPFSQRNNTTLVKILCQNEILLSKSRMDVFISVLIQEIYNFPIYLINSPISWKQFVNLLMSIIVNKPFNVCNLLTENSHFISSKAISFRQLEITSVDIATNQWPYFQISVLKMSFLFALMTERNFYYATKV